MKKSFAQLFLFAAFLIGFNSCQKDEDTVPVITDEEAAEIVEQAVVSNTYGMETVVTETTALTTEELEKSTLACGVAFDTTIIKTGSGQALYTYYYESNLNYELICQGFTPESFNIGAAVSGEYETPRLSSSDATTYDAFITNLLPVDPQYNYTGTMTRTGSQSIRVVNEKEMTSTLAISTTGLLVNKETNEIDGGTAEFMLTGTVVEGSNFMVEGSITFNGNGSATIEVNGNIFELQL